MGLFSFLKKNSKEDGLNEQADQIAEVPTEQEQLYQGDQKVQSYNDNGYKLIGYYANWICYKGFDPTKVPVEKLTHVNYAFANIKDGEVVLGDKWIDTDKSFGGDEDSPIKGNYNLFLNPNGPIKKRNPNLKVLISVGGWTWSKDFSDVAATEESREKFGISCATFCNKYNFDGIDIDWEFPIKGGQEGNGHRPEDGDNYALLLKTIRKHLDTLGQMNGKQYFLSIASTGARYNYSILDMKAIAEPLDWINVMNYDYSGMWSKCALHQANLYMEKPLPDGTVPTHNSISQCIEDFIKQGVPASKLVVGVPFYGRGFANIEANPNDYTASGLYAKFKGPLDGKENGSIQYHELRKDYINTASGYKRYWSENCYAPYLFNPEKRGLITYDDTWSMHYKAEYVKNNNLGGIMIWELSGDHEDELLNSIIITFTN